jgi:hypothetical protein
MGNRGFFHASVARQLYDDAQIDTAFPVIIEIRKELQQYEPDKETGCSV